MNVLPSLADLNHLQEWVFTVTIIVLGFIALAEGIGKVLDRLRTSLDEPQPVVDDVTERRRAKAAAVFAERRRQLDAIAGRR